MIHQTILFRVSVLVLDNAQYALLIMSVYWIIKRLIMYTRESL